MGESFSSFHYVCKICEKRASDRTVLIEHLRLEHELLEVASFAATTMISEQDRDRIASIFHARFEHLKQELSGPEPGAHVGNDASSISS